MRLARYQLVFQACALVHCACFTFLAQSATLKRDLRLAFDLVSQVTSAKIAKNYRLEKGPHEIEFHEIAHHEIEYHETE